MATLGEKNLRAPSLNGGGKWKQKDKKTKTRRHGKSQKEKLNEKEKRPTTINQEPNAIKSTRIAKFYQE